MSEKSSPKPPNKFPFLIAAAAVVAFGVIFTVGGFAFAASQEQHDSFCASCHTQPESTFYQRSTAQATDMASFHTTQKVNCIDCHSGVGLDGRIAAEMMGARNALLWYTGTAKQPAVQTVPVGDANCTKCHADVTQRGFSAKESITIPGGNNGRERSGRGNHWHTFLSRWQAAVPGVGSCTSCHNGHATGGTAQGGFLVSQVVQAQCDDCHKAIRTEGGG